MPTDIFPETEGAASDKERGRTEPYDSIRKWLYVRHARAGQAPLEYGRKFPLNGLEDQTMASEALSGQPLGKPPAHGRHLPPYQRRDAQTLRNQDGLPYQ
jgi:hypothetical protein